LFIFIWQQNDIGIVRLDSKTDSLDIFEISVLVDEKFQNRGFATIMISQVIHYAKKNLSAKEIRAVVHLENYQSISLFAKLDFSKTMKIQEQFEEYSFIC
jgi:RimJ/RimL family protein N-acetyltransferase